MGKVGRPSKLAPELQEMICKYLMLGLYVEDVCNIVEISKETFYRWLNTNKEFSNAVKKAMATAEARALSKIRDGSQGWQGEAWFLERRFPDKWGKKDKFSIQGDVGGKIVIEFVEAKGGGKGKKKKDNSN